MWKKALLYLFIPVCCFGTTVDVMKEAMDKLTSTCTFAEWKEEAECLEYSWWFSHGLHLRYSEDGRSYIQISTTKKTSIEKFKEQNATLYEPPACACTTSEVIEESDECIFVCHKREDHVRLFKRIHKDDFNLMIEYSAPFMNETEFDQYVEEVLPVAIEWLQNLGG